MHPRWRHTREPPPSAASARRSAVSWRPHRRTARRRPRRSGQSPFEGAGAAARSSAVVLTWSRIELIRRTPTDRLFRAGLGGVRREECASGHYGSGDFPRRSRSRARNSSATTAVVARRARPSRYGTGGGAGDSSPLKPLRSRTVRRSIQRGAAAPSARSRGECAPSCRRQEATKSIRQSGRPSWTHCMRSARTR